MSNNERRRTTIRIASASDAARTSTWQVDKCIFGKFFEMNGKDTYPGIIDECIANGSFEAWYARRKKDGANPPWFQRTEVLYRDTPVYPGLAYPWEPAFGEAGPSGTASNAYEQPEGGIHGSREGRRFQRLRLRAGEGDRGIMQRIALADERTLRYRLRFHARAEGAVEAFEARLEDAAGRRVTGSAVTLSQDWSRYEIEFAWDRPTEERYLDSPFGAYRLVFAARGDGAVDLDWTTLTAADAVEGMFNPTTIELLKQHHVASIRWGGNYANEYHWKDGIGPWEERPVRKNLNWGGLEPNYFGTNEFLRLCELTGAEPFMNAGFSYDLPPEEAADWVEYVNGSTDTPMGRLRAEHGYPKPWNVKLWQIGNETYGDYQFGYTDSIDFARRIKGYYEAMKKADPSITIIVAGEDPMYLDFSEVPGEPPFWNERLFKLAGKPWVDGIDIHQYTRGIRDTGLRAEWLERNGADPVMYNQVLVAYPTQYETSITGLREQAKPYGFDPLVFEIGEWNLEPVVDSGWPCAEYETMAHACYCAGMYNVFIRQGDAVKYAYQRDNALYYRAYPVDLRPTGPGNDTLKLYAELFAEPGAAWHKLSLDVEGPTFTIPQTWVRIREMEGVRHIDASAIVSSGGSSDGSGGERIALFVVNRDLKKTHTVELLLDGESEASEVSALLQSADTPFVRQTDWKEPLGGYGIKRLDLHAESNGRFVLEMPPGAVARVMICNRKQQRKGDKKL